MIYQDECPVILVQFLLQLYHGSTKNQTVFMDVSVLTALTLTLVPPQQPSTANTSRQTSTTQSSDTSPNICQQESKVSKSINMFFEITVCGGCVWIVMRHFLFEKQDFNWYIFVLLFVRI